MAPTQRAKDPGWLLDLAAAFPLPSLSAKQAASKSNRSEFAPFARLRVRLPVRAIPAPARLKAQPEPGLSRCTSFR